MTRRPADLLPPRLDEARLARQWSRIGAQLDLRPVAGRRRLAWSVGAAALAAAALLVQRGLPAGTAVRLPQGALVGSDLEPLQASLADGSDLTLQPRSRLRVERIAGDEIRLALLEGGASFDVARNPKRRFRVLVAGVRVDVIGTRFRVVRVHGADGEQVRVSVERGVVEVATGEGAGDVRRLVAGDSSSVPIGEPGGSEPDTVTDAVDEVLPRPADADEPAPSAPEASRPRPRAAPAPAPEAVQADAASAIFAEANLARRAGRIAEAEAAYAQLLARHPSDPRAGLAAFELGRLRMDALGNPRGAIQALRRALREPSSAAFHEDAMARLVLAYDTLHEVSACRRAREQYLSRYPGGVHVAALSVRCDPE